MSLHQSGPGNPPDEFPEDFNSSIEPLREVGRCFDALMAIKQAIVLPAHHPDVVEKVEAIETLLVDVLERLFWDGQSKDINFTAHLEKVGIAKDGGMYVLVDLVDEKFRSTVPVVEMPLGEPICARIEPLQKATRFLVQFSPTDLMPQADPRYFIIPIFSSEAFKELVENLKQCAHELNNLDEHPVSLISDNSRPSYLYRRIFDELNFQIQRRLENMPSDKHMWISDIKKIEINALNQAEITVAVDTYSVARGFKPLLKDVRYESTSIEKHRFALHRNQFGFAGVSWVGPDLLSDGHRAAA